MNFYKLNDFELVYLIQKYNDEVALRILEDKYEIIFKAKLNKYHIRFDDTIDDLIADYRHRLYLSAIGFNDLNSSFYYFMNLISDRIIWNYLKERVAFDEMIEELVLNYDSTNVDYMRRIEQQLMINEFSRLSDSFDDLDWKIINECFLKSRPKTSLVSENVSYWEIVAREKKIRQLAKKKIL